MKNKYVRDLTLAAMFVAMGLVLPFVTGQVPQIGNMLLPMHIPVLLCGLICGWKYGLAVGFILPLIRNLIFGMPPMPTALTMAFELAAYGAVVAIIFCLVKKQNVLTLYVSLIGAMLAGRIVLAIAKLAFLGFFGKQFVFEAFLAEAFVNAVPGIILQLILIPAIMIALDKAKLTPMKK